MTASWEAATVAILSEGRFRLGLGAGENLNEHVVGKRWPAVGVRHEMLVEAVDVITALLDGEHVNHRGQHFDVESARLYDLPDRRVPIGIAVSGERSCIGLGWKVNADLPVPSSFAAATQFVRPDDVGDQLPCGPDVQEYVEKIQPFVDAGFTEVALVQIGGEQQEPFLRWAEAELLPALRQLRPSAG